MSNFSSTSSSSRGQQQQQQQRFIAHPRQQPQQQQQTQSFLRPPPTQFQTFEEIEFCRPDPSSSFRVTVNSVENEPYVSIAHWWFNRSQGAWYPSRKQVFLPKAAWFGLLEASERISEVIEPLEGLDGQQQGTSALTVSLFCIFIYI